MTTLKVSMKELAKIRIKTDRQSMAVSIEKEKLKLKVVRNGKEEIKDQQKNDGDVDRA